MCQIYTLNFFTLGYKVEENDFAHSFEETTEVKNFLRLSTFIWIAKATTQHPEITILSTSTAK